ncbi:MAG: transposase [Firmicutes bacterium]|nr:transposase [Bacillota bacterium]
MMVKVLLYGYWRGIRSSRKLERALYEDVGFRVLSANQQPDSWTIAAFRRRHYHALGDELPEHLRDPKRRLEAIRRAKAELEAEAKRKAAAKEQKKENQGQVKGRRKRAEETPPGKAQYNFTDPDSRIMLSSERAFIQAYNAQLAVDAETQIAVAGRTLQPGCRCTPPGARARPGGTKYRLPPKGSVCRCPEKSLSPDHRQFPPFPVVKELFACSINLITNTVC